MHFSVALSSLLRCFFEVKKLYPRSLIQDNKDGSLDDHILRKCKCKCKRENTEIYTHPSLLRGPTKLSQK